ncbi:unnamed protein product, partial [Effrenium voratum]
MCGENGCEFTWDVGLSVLALSAALFGLVVGIKGFSQGKSCCDGWGSQAATVLSNVKGLAGLFFVLVPPFCALCAWCVAQSFFHLGRFQVKALECFMTSRGLRILQITANLLFFLCLGLSQLLLLWVFGTSFLGHLCQNHMLVSPAQMVAVGISNSPRDMLENVFSPTKDSSTFLMLGLREAMQGMSITNFCETMPYADAYLFDIWMGTFLLMISQSIMAVALRGEKQRVAVHEELEDDYGTMAGEAVQGLLKNRVAVSGIATAVAGPAVGGLLGAGMQA